MDKADFPQNLIFDVHDIVSEFMCIYRPGGEPWDQYDHVFVEEVLTVLYPSFMDFKNFERTLAQQMMYFADNTVHYRDDVRGQGLLMEAASTMARNIVLKLMNNGTYVNGFFPYVFKQLTPDRALVFDFAPEYVGDRYCDPRFGTDNWTNMENG